MHQRAVAAQQRCTSPSSRLLSACTGCSHTCCLPRKCHALAGSLEVCITETHLQYTFCLAGKVARDHPDTPRVSASLTPASSTVWTTSTQVQFSAAASCSCMALPAWPTLLPVNDSGLRSSASVTCGQSCSYGGVLSSLWGMQAVHSTPWVWLTTLRCLLSSRSRRSKMAASHLSLCW